MANGYRVYGDDALTYLRLARQTQSLEITLKEARELIRLVQRRQPPCQRVHALVAKRLKDVETTIRDLSLLRGKLKTILKETYPMKCPSTELCPN
jgi:DNA-binding transcriptional MerR regulator